MIPKIIHYCWFGRNSIPPEMKICMDSWKKHCPEYEIQCWNEDNFDIEINDFVKKAYNEKKWAFVTDYARLWIIYHYGGFYLDTDVELVKPLDELCKNEVFFGCEGENWVATGLGFGAVPYCQIIRDNMKVYESMDVYDENGNFSVKPCPFYTTELLKSKGINFPINNIVRKNNITIFPSEYFNPYNWASGKTKLTKNTYSIHHYAASWMSLEGKRGIIEQHYYTIYKEKYGQRIADIWSYYFWSKNKMVELGLLKLL